MLTLGLYGKVFCRNPLAIILAQPHHNSDKTNCYVIKTGECLQQIFTCFCVSIPIIFVKQSRRKVDYMTFTIAAGQFINVQMR